MLLAALATAACSDIAEFIPGDGSELRDDADTTPEATATPILTNPGPVFEGGQGGPPPSAIPDHELARSVAQVQALDGDDAVRIGSGVVVDPDERLILTTFPLVDPYLASGEPAYTTIAIAIAPEPGASPRLAYEAELVAAEPEKDLAVLRLVADYGEASFSGDGPSLEGAYIGDTSSAAAGSPIRIFGYPGATGAQAAQAVSTTHGNITGQRGEIGMNGRAWFKTDTRLPAGLSGGPVFDTLGQLLGVLAQPTYLPDAQVSHVRPLEVAFPIVELARTRTGQQPYRPPLHLRGHIPGHTDPLPGDGVWVSRPAFAENAIEGLGTRDLLDYGVTFDEGLAALYYEFVLMGIEPDTVVEELWYLDGVQQDSLSSTFTWDGGLFGMISDRITAPGASGLPSGRWRLEIHVDDELRASATAFIGVEPRTPRVEATGTGAAASPDGTPGAPVEAGSEQLLAFFDFEDVDAAASVEWIVFRNNQRVYQSSPVPWSYGTSGRLWVGYHPESPISSGTWEVELHVGGELAAIAEVTVP